jgi:hypothetical protein
MPSDDTHVGLSENVRSPEKAGEVETRSGLSYATHDGVALQGDLYRPKEQIR